MFRFLRFISEGRLDRETAEDYAWEKAMLIDAIAVIITISMFTALSLLCRDISRLRRIRASARFKENN
jgi:hypothetical protein